MCHLALHLVHVVSGDVRELPQPLRLDTRTKPFHDPIQEQLLHALLPCVSETRVDETGLHFVGSSPVPPQGRFSLLERVSEPSQSLPHRFSQPGSARGRSPVLSVAALEFDELDGDPDRAAMLAKLPEEYDVVRHHDDLTTLRLSREPPGDLISVAMIE